MERERYHAGADTAGAYLSHRTPLEPCKLAAVSTNRVSEVGQAGRVPSQRNSTPEAAAGPYERRRGSPLSVTVHQ